MPKEIKDNQVADLSQFSELKEMSQTLQECVRKDQQEPDPDNRQIDHFYYWTFESLRRMRRDRDNISFREIFEAFVPDGGSYLDSRRRRSNLRGMNFLQESASAVDTSHFRNIMGQVTFSEVLDVLDEAQYIGMDLVTKRPTDTKFQEMIPGIGRLGDEAEAIGEGKSYPRIGLTEEYIRAPEATKDGFIIEFTEEFLREEKTGLALERARAATESLAITQEKEILNTVLGITTSYSRNGGPLQATYGDTHTQGTFDNLAATNELDNWTAFDTVMNLFTAITDPNNGEPVNVAGAMEVVVPTELWAKVNNILFGSGIEWGIRESAVAGTADPGGVMASPNPVTSNKRGFSFKPLTSPLVSTVVGGGGATTTWFVGQFPKAFGYREYWPIQMDEMPAESEASWDRDVVAGFKVRRLGAPMVREPRYVVKCTA